MPRGALAADMLQAPLLWGSPMVPCPHGPKGSSPHPRHGCPRSSPLELKGLGHISWNRPQTDGASVSWVMGDTGRSLWLLLCYYLSNSQALGRLPLTLRGSLSYCRANKLCCRRCTEQIQFVFIKSSTWKMGSTLSWSRRWGCESDSLRPDSTFTAHWRRGLVWATALLRASTSPPVKSASPGCPPYRVFTRILWESYKVSSVDVSIKQGDIHFLHNPKFNGLNYVILISGRKIEVRRSIKHW